MTWPSLTERARVASGLAAHARRIGSPTADVLARWAEQCRRDVT